MSHIFLFEEVARFAKNNEISKEDIWRNIEHITHLTALGEISLDDAERYTYMLCKMAEEL